MQSFKVYLRSIQRGVMAKFRKRDFVAKFLGTCFAIAISFSLHHFPLYSVEALGYDLLFRLRPKATPSNTITTVAIDRNTISQLGHDPKWEDYAIFLKELNRHKPKAVLFLLDPHSLSGKPQSFAQISKQTDNLVFSIEKLLIAGREDEFKLKEPLAHLKILSGNISADTKNFAGDGVSRRSIISYENLAFAQTVIAQTVTGAKDPESYKGAFSFKGSTQVLTNMNPRGSFVELSFLDILKKQKDITNNIKDKIIVVGFKTNSEAANYVKTVFSRDVVAMSKLEYNANIIHTLITDSGIEILSSLYSLVLSLVVALLTLFFAFKLRPVTGILGIFILLGGILLTSLTLFVALGYYLAFMHSFIVAVVCYYFLIPYRLIVEHRKSWEYQQKNKLLTEVEELKTNFISMMSHDLKTPLARIQGMADLALRDQSVVSNQQKSALSSISKSTDELNHFIDSVLNLSRVESQGIKIQLTPKDINQIIEKAVARYSEFAKEKNIEIICELEPLFSIKVDQHLIQQVVGNLIENSIKYSAENSKILISTEEVNGEVVIQVADQGKGIPQEELRNIFMKFYRSKDVKTSSVKGNGLGLYLSSYFIKLHQGKINVESVENQGSTFSVHLPTNL